ncbi:hypothetical protein [Endozoicomonas arenosclerae]|uniref:hypothetical protein n=1 Tax=Endozoicomonas arenosclerae TaxID=1633495 RepID=UPI00129466BE|nr:hypothetical protein [Endozoicomonas arenosclerae]
MISIIPPATEAQPPGSTLIVPIYHELTDPVTGQIKQQTYSAADHGNWQLRVKAETASDFHCNHCKISSTLLAEGVEYILEPAKGEASITLKSSGSLIHPDFVTVFANNKSYSVLLKTSSEDSKTTSLNWAEILSLAFELYDSIDEEESCICPGKPGGKEAVQQSPIATETITLSMKDLVAHTATRPYFDAGSLKNINAEINMAASPFIQEEVAVAESLFPSTPHQLVISNVSATGRQAASNGGLRHRGNKYSFKLFHFDFRKGQDPDDDGNNDEGSNDNGRGGAAGGGGGDNGGGNFWEKHSLKRTLFKNRYKVAGSIGLVTGGWITIAVVVDLCNKERERAEQHNATESFTCRSASAAVPVFTVIGSLTSTLLGQGVLAAAETAYHCYCYRRNRHHDVESGSNHSE